MELRKSVGSLERAGAASYLAAARVHWAEMLVQRADPGDAEQARELAAEGLATADDLGLAYVGKRARLILG